LLALSERLVQLGPSCEAAVAAKAALEQVIRDLSAFEAPTDGTRKLCEALLQRGRYFLQRCKCLLNWAIEASREREEHPSARPTERYVFCEGPCPADLLQHVGLASDEGITHGSINTMGVVAEDVPDGGCLVHVIADVDPCVHLAFVADIDVRRHVLNTANRLGKLLELRESQETALQDLASLTRRL